MAFENLEPKEVFGFFEKICSIPHGSGNVEKISNYLVDFARERNLEVTQDAELNVIIKAPGSKGYEDREPVILQGHMDMVAVSEEGADIDMKTQGLKTMTDGEFVWAEGTSLGGDDGIAVAYCLALLDSNNIPHPPLEVVITTNEETGMYGAAAIDLSGLRGRKMINIDNEEEGVFITSCAGGARVYSELPVARKNVSGIPLAIQVSGLLGGHSGEMIKLGRGNACHILARTLFEAGNVTEFYMDSIEGGVADNAIPSFAKALVLVPKAGIEGFLDSISKTTTDISGELEGKDPDILVTANGYDTCQKELLNKLCSWEETTAEAIDADGTKKLLSLICTMPDGVQTMSAQVEGLVETSLNLGIVKTTKEAVTLEHSVRSSVESAKAYLIKRLKLISEVHGAKVTVSGPYPGWKYRPKSELRDHMVNVYRELYGKEPQLMAIHAGLECGILSDKIEDLDCISIGPDMQDIHSPKEKLSVKSTANVWEYLKAVLR